MKTIKFLSYSLFVLFLSISISSCNGDDGATGPAGADGINGQDGADGNANVQTYVFDTSTRSGYFFSFELPEITQDVLDNDVILTYHESNSFYYSSPGPGYSANYLTRVYSEVGFHYLEFYDWNGATFSISEGAVEKVKIIIIESTTTTSDNGTRSTSSKQRVFNELKNAGIDTNDYYAICEYYEINPE